MFEVFLTTEQRGLLKETQEFVKWVPRQLILDMDDEKIKFPKEFIQEAGRRNLDERNIEADVHLSSEEAAEEKVYE